MKFFALLFLLIPFLVSAQTPRLETYKKNMMGITEQIKKTAAEYCAKKVAIACKIQKGERATPEESYDKNERADFKDMESRLLVCKKNLDCQLSTGKPILANITEGFGKKCKHGEQKYCFNHKVFTLVMKGNQMMQDEAAWLEKEDKKKKKTK